MRPQPPVITRHSLAALADVVMGYVQYLHELAR